MMMKRSDKFLELTNDLRIETSRFKDIYFDSKYLSIIDNVIIVKKGFIWNGCTWARDGKRDGRGIPLSAIASCVHDALYFYTIKGISRDIKDLIFYDELKRVNFKFLGVPGSLLYLVGVKTLGWMRHNG